MNRLQPAITFFTGVLVLLVLSRAASGAPPSFRTSCGFSDSPDFNACETDIEEIHALGIYWSASQKGVGAASGNHLRWSFNAENRHFPTGGFEIQRRSEGAHELVWRTLAIVYPATSKDEAVARIPASLTATERCSYEAGAEDLVDLLELIYCDDDDGIESYWRFEGSDDLFYKVTAGYFNLSTKALSSYPLDGDPPPLGFEFNPRELLLLTAIDPVVARIAGLYYVDVSARPDLLYDYRIVGHYSDRTLCAVVQDVGSATTRPLNAPGLNAAGDEMSAIQADATKVASRQVRGSDPEAAADPSKGETWVELEWLNEAAAVAETGGEVTEMVPSRYLVERKDGSGSAFSRIPAGADSESGCQLFAAPVIIPDTDPEEESEAFRAPPYYRDFTVAVGETYSYQVTGIDLFGRCSPPAVSNEVTIVDLSAPPPPIVTEARFFQREPRDDRTAIERDLKGLSLAEIKEIRHAWAHGSADAVLRLRWLWLDSWRATHGDTVEFRVYISTAANPVEVVDVYDSTQHLVSTAVPPKFPKHDYFERHIAIPAHVAEAPVSDDPPELTTTYYQVHVTAVDSSGNESLVLKKRTVVLRDITAPDAPTSLPYLPAELSEPPPPDVEGRVALPLEWTALANLCYRIFRVDERAVCSAMIASGTPVPICGNVSDADLHAFLLGRPDLFEPVSGAVLGPFGTLDGASHVDLVPGTTANRYIYALRAMDPAGNTSDISAPGRPIFVPDRLAPAKPVISRALAGSGDEEGNVLIEWSRGREDDLSTYILYRADSEAYAHSKRRMTVVCEIAPSTSSYECADTPPRPERMQYYRLEAVDTSGNHSLLSEIAAVRALDLIPPSTGGWTATLDCLDDVTLTVTPPASATDEFRIVRRQDNRTVALTGWSNTGFVSRPDATSLITIADYFLQVRDQAGNVSLEPIENPCREGAVPVRRAPSFVRGDADADGSIAIADAVAVLGHLYLGRPAPGCLDAADADVSGALELSDAVRLLTFLFLGGEVITAPFPDCGQGSLRLGCDAFPACE